MSETEYKRGVCPKCGGRAWFREEMSGMRTRTLFTVTDAAGNLEHGELLHDDDIFEQLWRCAADDCDHEFDDDWDEYWDEIERCGPSRWT